MYLREAAAAALLVLAALFAVISGLGIMRSRNNFAALHALGVTSVLLPLFALLAVVVATGFGQSSIQMLVLFAILTGGAPIASHALAVAERRRKPR